MTIRRLTFLLWDGRCSKSNTLSKNILDSYFDQLLDVYRYLSIQKMFSQKYKKNISRMFTLKRPFYIITFQYTAKKCLRGFCIAAHPDDNVVNIAWGIPNDFRMEKRCKHLPLWTSVRNLFPLLRIFSREIW